MESGNRSEINFQLALYRENGVIVFEKVFSIPTSERIPALTKSQEGRAKVCAALCASLSSALNNLNLRVGMNEEQIFDLAEEIIDQSQEDNLSLEDVLLFLKELIGGKCGKIYDRLDMPTFFELFETYREKRHQKLMDIRNNQHLMYKGLGDATRSAGSLGTDLDKHLAEFSTKLQAKNDEIKELRAERNRRNQMDNF